ncbi:Uma2 family endonuclease [Saccharopolyspora gloriosae]|uniref:Uma2 family endonuclease n=1 Tax=Saccharopolyspora gloriosae TaxID=455344 RepID=UPI001FB7D2CA|nr:Uma2 family endonuclease [Saccharopolyspora gloriosae]
MIELLLGRADGGGMSVMSWPDHLLTLEEFDRLPEDNSRRYELQEGVLQVSPKAAAVHQRLIKRLTAALDAQLPAEWEAMQDVEVVVGTSFPPTVRIPDAILASTQAFDVNPNRLNATDVALAVEVISPGSRRIDRLTKVQEYAQAGIPHYWVFDIDTSVTFTALRLGEGGYESGFEGGGMFKTDSPFEFAVDLSSLVVRGPGR